MQVEAEYITSRRLRKTIEEREWGMQVEAEYIEPKSAQKIAVDKTLEPKKIEKNCWTL